MYWPIQQIISATSLSIIAVQQAIDWIILLREEQDSYKKSLLSMFFFFMLQSHSCYGYCFLTLWIWRSPKNMEMAKKYTRRIGSKTENSFLDNKSNCNCLKQSYNTISFITQSSTRLTYFHFVTVRRFFQKLNVLSTEVFLWISSLELIHAKFSSSMLYCCPLV